MSLGRYLLGAGEIALIAGVIGFGAVRLRARLLPAWSGAPARLAEVVIGASALLVCIELLGVAQILDPAPAVALPLIAGGLMAWFGAPLRAGKGERSAPPQMGTPATAIALALAFLVVMHWAVISQHSYAVGMYGGDESWYHLPFPARIAQNGAITALHYASPSYLSWFHPLNSELFHALGMVLTGRDILSPFLNLFWMGVALLAAWCVGRPFGVGPLTLAAAALVLDLPVLAGTQAGAAMSDLFGVTMLLTALALLVSAYERPGADSRQGVEPAALVVAGLAAGLAMGAKLGYAAPVALLTACVIAYSPRGRRRASAVLWILPVLLTGAYWYVKNFYYVLNPFPYVSKLGPIDLPGPDEGLNGGRPFAPAHYAFDGKVWSDHLAPGFSSELGPVWFLLLAVALVGIGLGLAQRRNPMIRVLAVLGAALFVFWLFAPAAAEGPEGNPVAFEAGLRVLAPALIIGLVLAMVAIARLGDPWRWAALCVVALLTLVATRRGASFWDSAGQVAGAVLIAAALILLPLAAIAWGRRGSAGRLAAVLGVLAAVVLGAGLNWPRTQYYFDHRYRTADVPPLFTLLNMVPLYRWASGVQDRRVGTSGILQFGLYGDDLSNHVQYLGKVGDDRSFREIGNCRTWRTTINKGHYDYVVAMPRFGGDRELQARWTRGPKAHPVLHSAPITVFRVTGKLDPSACGTLPSL